MIWPFYAAVLAILMIVLSVRTLRLRRRMRITIGDGGNPIMSRAMRVHANCTEYVPLGILLIAGAEAIHAPAQLLHTLGLLLMTGRLIHAFGIAQRDEILTYRIAGMVLTFSSYGTAILFILWRTLA